MKIKKKYIIFPLLGMIPVVVSFLPVEILGVNGGGLQRLNFGNSRIPYWDFIILLAPVMLLQSPAFKAKLRLDSIMALFVVFVSFINFFFRNSSPINQAIGLLFGHSSLIIYFLSSTQILRKNHFEGFMKIFHILFVFSIVLGGVLVLYTVLPLGMWEKNIIQISRFAGEDVRLRWDAFRAAEKIVIAMCASYCGFFLYIKGDVRLLLATLILILWQVVSSSRGGLLLVVVGFVIGYFMAKNSNCRVYSKNLLPIINISLVIFFVLGFIYVVQSERILLLLQEMSEITRDDSIRERMSSQAMLVAGENLFFGKGYFNLFELPEWQPFILDNMMLPIHNIFVQYVIYIGLVGVFPIIIIIIITANNFLKLYFLIKSDMTSHNLDARLFFSLSFCCYIGGLYMLFFQSLDRITAYFLWSVIGVSMNPSFWEHLIAREKHICFK